MPGQDTMMGTLRAMEYDWPAVADISVCQRQFKAEHERHQQWLECMYEVIDPHNKILAIKTSLQIQEIMPPAAAVRSSHTHVGLLMLSADTVPVQDMQLYTTRDIE